MNNNFDENNQFVRRPVQNGGGQPHSGSIPHTGSTPGHLAHTGNGTCRPVASGGTPHHTQNVSTLQRTARNNMPPQAGRAYAEPKARQEQPRPTQSARVSGSTQRQHTQNAVVSQKTKGKTNYKKLLVYFLIFLVMLGALIFLSFFVILATLHTTPENVKEGYIITYGDDEKAAETEDSVMINKVLYINMTKVSDMCGFTVSGSKSSLRYTADKGEYVEFSVGSVSAKVNGETVNMKGAALIRENENLWIPVEFAKSIFNGIDVTIDENNDKITVTRTVSVDSTADEPKYENITFRIKGSVPIGSINEDDGVGTVQELGFSCDLSEYEQYMNPEDRDSYLILVNKTHTIDSEYIPENLTSVENTRTDRAKEQMAECAEKALEAMFKELYAAGYTDVTVTSGYRSYSKQSLLFNTYLQNEMSNNPSLSKDEAKQKVLTYSAAPGTSEHQTGLCCDMHNISSADKSFANKAAYKWLFDNCYKFGFILRFPEDKTDVTGYDFEPWHYRFVGRYHATRMHKLGMCLEEYTEYLSKATN